MTTDEKLNLIGSFVRFIVSKVAPNTPKSSVDSAVASRLKFYSGKGEDEIDSDLDASMRSFGCSSLAEMRIKLDIAGFSD